MASCSYAKEHSSAIDLAFCDRTFGVVLRLMNELSPSVPHCRDVTEQPIRLAKAMETSVNLMGTARPRAPSILEPELRGPIGGPLSSGSLFLCMGAFPCDRCVFDPSIANSYVFCLFFFARGESSAPRCAKSLSPRPFAFIRFAQL